MKRKLVYLIPVVVLPIVILVSFLGSGMWTFFTLVFAFVFIPTVELFSKGTTVNLTKEQEALERKDPYYDILLYLFVPFLYVFLFWYCYKMAVQPLSIIEMVGITTAMGIACGVVGINLGHELGHRSKGYEQTMSKALLLTSLYMHFFIEHNRGHHKNIATRFDPATSRLNEPIYTYYFRTITGSWISAWHLENHRLRKAGKSLFTWENEMIRFVVIQSIFCLAIFLIFSYVGGSSWAGTKALVGFMISAFIGALLLETVNYIEHYGLERIEISPSRFEKVQPHHSWNSNHEMGRIFLFELTRHSDHHYNSGRKYQILRHYEDAPQMPTGYPAMMVLSLFPPLWFKIMNPLVEKHRVFLHGGNVNYPDTQEISVA